MITKKEFDIFKFHKGHYEGYTMQFEDETGPMSSDHWFLLDGFMQDIYLIRKEAVSESFKQNVLQKMKETCDEEIIEMIFKLEEEINR